MASDVVPHGIKIEFNGIQNTVPVVNRVYVTKTGAIGSADLDDAITTSLAYWNAVKAAYHPSFTLANITATDVSVANGLQTIFPVLTGNVGTSTGSPAAANAAVVCSLRTAHIGRSFRGRFYFGALSNNNIDTAQSIGLAAASFYASSFQDYIDGLTAVGQTLVVVSKFAAGAARLVALTTEVISIIVDTKIDSQRRRTAN